MTNRLPACLCILLLCSAATTARAGEKVWGALVLATVSDHPAETPAALAPYAKKMRGIFGFNEFRVLGEGERDLQAGGDLWLIPSKKFYASIVARDIQGPGRLLYLRLYCMDKLLVKTNAWLAPGGPLFIRGGQCGGGQLIIVLAIE